MWLASSTDRRVSIWVSDWMKDKCELLDWLTFPAPSIPEVQTRKVAHIKIQRHFHFMLINYIVLTADNLIYCYECFLFFLFFYSGVTGARQPTAQPGSFLPPEVGHRPLHRVWSGEGADILQLIQETGTISAAMLFSPSLQSGLIYIVINRTDLY